MARRWVPAWIDALRDAMRHCATDNAGERSLNEHAISMLLARRDMVTRELIRRLDVAWEARSLTSGRAGNAADSSPASVFPSEKKESRLSLEEASESSMALLSDDDVQQDMTQARMLQMVKLSVDDELVELQARVCGLRGMSHVRASANPLQPEPIVDAVMAAFEAVCSDDAVRTRWMQAGAMPLGRILEHFYQDVNHMISGWKVESANYQIASINAMPSAASSGMPTSTKAANQEEPLLANEMSGDSPQAVLTLDHLQQLLVGNLGRAGQYVAGRRLGGASNAMARALAAEMVGLMIRRVSDGQKVQPLVQAMVRDMKPVLMQIAHSDPGFYAEKDNAAQRLLSAIEVRCQTFASEQDTGFAPFAQAVHDAVRGLSAGPMTPVQRVAQQAQLLAMPEAGRELSQGSGMPVDELAQRIAAEISVRKDFGKAPAVVRRFLTGTWSRVIAQAQRTAAQARQQGKSLSERQGTAELRYRDVVPDILWSSQLRVASRNRPRLIHLIAHVLRTLREGLDSIDFTRQESEAFFQALMGLHEAAYRTLHRPRRDESPGDGQFVASRPMQDRELPWMPLTDASSAGQRRGQQDARCDTAFQMIFADTQPSPLAWPSPQQSEQRH
ncbi:hypothetical protein NBRC116584_33350 [Hydrogenophaga sp. 5NK40-0174]